METSLQQTEIGAEKLSLRVEAVLDDLQEQYSKAGTKKMQAYSRGKLIEAEKQAAIQQTIFNAMNLVRKHLGSYLLIPEATLQPCGVCGRLVPRSELIDACCRVCKRTA